ncbi:hypothetical protein [Nostoc sp. PA-18-2419]|uniref:hypothetical protein n=1 Tax=Nostoc sp. PA-18-2419 TaxID=2575443 RepID=UPI0011092AA1|nr:hypothetical protein [Nostoc sp. PA-18-2419]
MLPIFLGKLVLLANYYISEILMEIPKISALKNFVGWVADEINYWVVLIAGNLQSTLDEVFHVGS